MNFLYGELPISVLLNDEVNFFSAKTIFTACGYKQNTRKQIENILKKYLNDTQIKDFNEELYISESGLYELMMVSRKEECVAFRRWVCSNVLPSLRNKPAPTPALAPPITSLNTSLNVFKEKEKEEELGMQIIYIATTPTYQEKNIFKVGGCASIELLPKRLISYNTGRPEADLMFFCYRINVLNYHSVESRLKTLAKDIKKEPNEMYNIHFDTLLELIAAVIHGLNTEFQALEKYLTSREILDKRPPAKVEDILKKIVPYNFIVVPGTNTYSDQDRLKIMEIVHNVIYSSSLSATERVSGRITRMQIFQSMETLGHKFNRKDMWACIRTMKLSVKIQY